MPSGEPGGRPDRCQGTRADGTPCTNAPLSERDRCLMHDPQADDVRRAARRKGAGNAARVRGLESRRAKLDTPRSLVRFTARVIHRTLDGELDVQVARTVLYGVAIQRALVQASEVEARLAALEARLGAPPVPMQRAG